MDIILDLVTSWHFQKSGWDFKSYPISRCPWDYSEEIEPEQGNVKIHLHPLCFQHQRCWQLHAISLLSPLTFTPFNPTSQNKPSFEKRRAGNGWCPIANHIITYCASRKSCHCKVFIFYLRMLRNLRDSDFITVIFNENIWFSLFVFFSNNVLFRL